MQTSRRREQRAFSTKELQSMAGVVVLLHALPDPQQSNAIDLIGTVVEAFDREDEFYAVVGALLHLGSHAPARRAAIVEHLASGQLLLEDLTEHPAAEVRP